MTRPVHSAAHEERVGGYRAEPCPLAACYFTEEGVCDAHPQGCPEHDCGWCQPDEDEHGY